MIVGLLSVELFIYNTQSLKAKRRVLKSIKERLRKQFNISIAEIEYQDKWQKAALGIAYLGNDKGSVNSALDKVLNFIETVHDVNLTDHNMEII